MRTRLQVHRETEEGPRFTCRQHPHQRAHLFQLPHLPGHPVTEAAASLWGLGAHTVTRVDHRPPQCRTASRLARPPSLPGPTFGRGFRGAEGPLDDGLGLRVLFLQKVYGFSQIQQLGVLREK